MRVGKCESRQAKGIIMGSKSSGWLSDCSLMVDEYKYVSNNSYELCFIYRVTQVRDS